MIIFSLLYEGSEQFSPCCNKHWMSFGIVIGERLIIQLFLECKKDCCNVTVILEPNDHITKIKNMLQEGNLHINKQIQQKN